MGRRAVFAGGGDGGVHGPAGVDDKHITGGEKAREVPKTGVHDAVVVSVGDHETHLVAGEAPGLRRLARLQLGRELKVQAL
jgi:hypothetical protein